MKPILRIGIIGVSGYAGEKLLQILLKHPEVKITYLAAKIERKQHINIIYPYLDGHLDLECDDKFDNDKAVEQCDLIFLATPHTTSMKFAPGLLKNKKSVIDLSADYRLIDPSIYRQYYKVEHIDENNIKNSVYGLPELYREKIRSAKLIANPGCYPTAAILALAPLLENKLITPESIIIDAKSGFSGAGRETVIKSKEEISNNFKAYKVNIHQHAPEIDQEISRIYGKAVKIIFVPHLLPVDKGILETIYVRKASNAKIVTQNIIDLYRKFYAKEPFLRILQEDTFPQIKEVVDTNFCDIGIKENEDSIIIIAAIDNLLKGASGQAVQNMNIMYNFPEGLSL